MLDQEKKLQALDITVIMVLFVIGCMVGKLVMVNISDTWIGFNGPALGIIAIGELIWRRIRKVIERRLE